MAILEKEVWVKCGLKSDKHYEVKGYTIPRYKDKKGRMNVAIGTKILVKVEDLTERSNIRVTKICDDCGKPSSIQSYYNILISREKGDGKDRCPECASIQGGKTQKKNVTYERTLEYFALNNNMGYLLEEFSSKNEKKPNKLSYGTKTNVLWECMKCKSEYPMDVSYRTTRGMGCPYCECLWNTHPEIAKLLKDVQKGYELTAGSGKKEIFVCLDCGFEQTKSIYNVVRDGFSCSKCSDGIIYPEKFMSNFLFQLDVEYEPQKMFKWSNNKRYDFHIPSLNMIVETHGEQHYIDTGFGRRSISEEKENDKLKSQLAKDNNIEFYIVLDCRESNLEFIRNSIFNSKLKDIYNLNNINWGKCHEFASNNNLIKAVCDLWNDGIENTVQIGEMVKLNRVTVGRYLKRGAELGWCNYDPEETRKESGRLNGKTNGQKSQKEIVQLSKENELISIYPSIAEATRVLNHNKSGISNNCCGRLKTSGGYKWMYKTEYDKLVSSKEII